MDKEEMRPLFESAFAGMGYQMARDANGFYSDPEVNAMFVGWCAGGHLYWSRMNKKYGELERSFERLQGHLQELIAASGQEVQRPTYLESLKLRVVKASQP